MRNFILGVSLACMATAQSAAAIANAAITSPVQVANVEPDIGTAAVTTDSPPAKFDLRLASAQQSTTRLADPVVPAEEEAPKRKNRTGKKLLTGAGILVLVAAVAFGGWLAYYSYRCRDQRCSE